MAKCKAKLRSIYEYGGYLNDDIYQYDQNLPMYNTGGGLLTQMGSNMGQQNVQTTATQMQQNQQGQGGIGQIGNAVPIISMFKQIGEGIQNAVAPKNEHGYSDASDTAVTVGGIFNPREETETGVRELFSGDADWGTAKKFVAPFLSAVDTNNEKRMEHERQMDKQRMMQDVQNFQAANSIYQMGGSLNSNNNITEYNGNTHEAGGIPIGGFAEVEHNETRGVGNTKDYIFSDTLKVSADKKAKTFADASKDIEKKYKGAENDKFAMEAKNKELTGLMFEQEALKNSNNMNNKNIYAMGGEIDPPNKNPQNPTQLQQAPVRKEFMQIPSVPIDTSKITAGEPFFDDTRLTPYMQTEGWQKWPSYMKEDTLKAFQTTESIRDRKLDEYNLMSDAAKGIDPRYIRAYGDILESEGNRYANTIGIESQERYNRGLRNKRYTPKYPEAEFTSPRQFTENVAGSTAFYSPEGTRAHNALVERMKFSGGDENRRLYTDIEKDAFIDLKNRKNIDPNQTIFTVYPYKRRNKGKHVTLWEFMEDPELYRMALDPQQYRNLTDFLVGEQKEKNLIANNEQFKYGGRIKYDEGGPIHPLLQQAAQNMFNNGDYSNFNKGIQAPVLNFDNQDFVNVPPTVTSTGTMGNYNIDVTSPTAVKDQVTSGAYSINKTPQSDVGVIYNTKNNPTNPYWKGEKVNTEQYKRTGKGFDANRANAYMTSQGIDPEYSSALSGDPRLMQDYYNYIENYTSQSPENYQQIEQMIKTKYPDFSLKQGLSSGRKGGDRYGQHHQWMLDPQLVKQFFGSRSNIDYAKGYGVKAGEYKQPEIDLNAFRSQSGGTGGGGEGTNGTVPGGQGRLRGFRGDLLASGLSALPSVGMGIANFNLANNLNFDRTHAEIMDPDYVDPTRAIQEIRDQYAGTKDVARQVSGGSGNLMSNLIGATSSQAKATAGVNTQYDNINAGIYNQAAQFNAGQKQQVNNINAQIQAQEMRERTNLRQQAMDNMMQGLGTGINTYYDSKKYADAMNVAGDENYYYRRVGPAFNQTPVRVSTAEGFHFYEDPNTGRRVHLDPNTGREISYEQAVQLRKSKK